MTDGFTAAIAKLEFDKVRQRVVRYAASDPGRDLVRDLVPLIDPDFVRRELALVGEVKRLLDEESDFPLEGIHPILSSLQKSTVDGSVLLPREFVQILSTLRTSRVLRGFCAKRRDAYPLIWSLAEDLFSDKVLEYNIDQAIDDTGAVRANASRELAAIRRGIADRHDQLRKRLEHILRNVADLGFSQDEIITTREGRMVIPVKAEHKNRVHGFIHSASASGATVFIEPSETLDLNNEIRNLQFQEQREVERILRLLTQQVRDAAPPLRTALERLASIDCATARARYSAEILGTTPEITVHGPLRLDSARHPLLLMAHGLRATTPLDMTLGGDYRTLVISGPNAGGKSVAMKCVGMCVLMAQSGLQIPAGDASRLPVFTRLFVEIGDDQSIENDLSTFSSHLAHLKEILAHADDRSLVLIDEIGAGTDPAEGSAIAAAALEELTRRKAHTIATTHQGSLKVFAHDTDQVENGAMEFDQATLTPTYRFRAGVPGSSYALEMAARIGFTDELMERAKALVGTQQSTMESLLTELESSLQEYRRKLEEAREEKERASTLAARYDARVSSAAQELREMKRKAVDEAAKIVDDANALVEKSVKTIKEASADRSTVRTARDEIATMKAALAATRSTLPEDVKPDPSGALPAIAVGSTVKLRGGTDSGEVASIAPDGKSALVVFGSVKMRLPMNDLEATSARARVRPTATPAIPEKPETVERDLDLRGMTAEEAIPLVDKFIDTAILAGLHRVDVIHGKGTGALRKKIGDFLSHHPRVRSYRLGEWNEGGTGATVIELGDDA